MKSWAGGSGRRCPHWSQGWEQNMQKNLYLLVFIVAGRAEEACVEDWRCYAVLPPTLLVLDEAPGSGEAALSRMGLPGLWGL